MTNLDVMVKVISRVSGKPEELCRNVILASVGKDTGNLHNEVSDGESLVERMVTEEGPGILNWLIEGSIEARRLLGK